MSAVYRLDPELGYVPAIPEPFWYKGWRTFFRYRPACYQCRTGEQPRLFRTRREFDTHYALTHIERLPDEGHQDIHP